ncbi:MAG TPA: EAL domain-containing protein [Burkholderiaceae bacterium]|jgi:diguanylate cyclase (GGDEF)-like protein|nr:EAL domain-containing protein [Burkholderiaceae bacterium]
MKMRFHTLESRIVTLFLVLILMVQLAGFFVIRQGIDNNALASIRDQLSLGMPLFKHLLDQRATEKLNSARVLAKDFGFVKAVGTNDKETIESGLTNSRDRIKASLALLVATDHQIVASTAKQSPGNLEYAILRLIDKAERSPKTDEGEIGVSIFANQPYQVLVVPVKAPITLGWVAMAFPLDKQIAQEMRELSSLDLTFLVSGAKGEWIADASTLPRDEADSVATQLFGVSGGTSMQRMLRVADSDYSVRILPLAAEPGQSAVVVLQRSIDAAKAPYIKLQMTMLEITGLLILVAIATSFFAAKRIAGPLRDLTETAKRLGDGNYEGQIVIKREDEIGKLSKAFESMRDGIAKRELEIRRLAYWDTLTDLPNRAQFALRLDDAIKDARIQGNECYVLMMDLDRFKNVNDVLGHSFGDALLQQVATRLTKTVGAAYQVARLGGDEFAVLMPFIDLTEAKAIASRILKSLETPIALEEQTVDLGAGIGIAGYPSHGADAESLLSRAEVAMYSAKLSGNEAVLYDPVLDKTSQESLSLLSELRRALDQDEFKLFVQPKLSLSTGELIGLESLVRWQHPERGMIYPDHFIPFSEKTGFIRMLTRWMLEQSAMFCHDLIARGVKVKISVNLSARDLLDQNLPQKFADVLKRYEVDASSFCLEITESSIMDDPHRAQVTLEGLHAMGVDLSIDDFGTGYSSLAYLKRLPVDELKIDKSFVMNMERDIDDAKIVRSTIDLGHNMGLRVVAEGIESEAVWQILSKMGCDQGQGYFMSRPIAADQLVAWLAKWDPPRHSSALQKNLA